MKTRIDLRLRRVEAHTTWYVCVLIAVVLTVEILGRRGTSDLHDGVAMALLITLLVGGYVLMGKKALAWAKPLRTVLDTGLARLRERKFEIGIDLRHAPPIRAETPVLIRDLVITLAGLAVALAALAAFGDIDLRGVTTRILYVGHLVGLFLLWTALLFTMATSILLPAACIHDAFACRHVGTRGRPRRKEYYCIGGYFGAVVLMGALLPIWVPAALCGLALSLFVATMWRRSTPSVTLLWRGRSAPGVRSMEWRDYETACAVIVTLAFLDLLLLSLGGAAIGFGDTEATGMIGDLATRELATTNANASMPVTTTLGSLAAWLGGTALAAGGLFASGWITTQRGRDPSRPCPTTLHVRGGVTQRKRLLQLLTPQGWKTRFAPAAPALDDVPVELVDTMPPIGPGRRPWPLPVSLKGLEVPELIHLLGRRDEIQRRRALMGGLEKLFKQAARRNFRRGQGYWIAPHYWYISGMTRDVDEDQSDLGEGTVISGVIGPSYHRVLPRSSRQHLHAILRSLEVDLIFLEDGIGFRGFRRVLRLLFEQYDVHGGRQRLEDRHLHGIPGLKAVLHEYQLGNPLRKKGYPEPDYETLGRARILHIFKDRGEHEELVEDPVVGRDVPVPVLG